MRRAAVVTLWILAMSAGARIANAGEVTVAVKAGFIAATIDVRGAGRFDTNPNLGLAIGGSAGIALGSGVRLQPELLFTTPRFESGDFPLPLAIKSRAFEVPILLVKAFRSDRRTRPLVYAGPRFAFITRISQIVGQTQSDVTRDFKSVDVAVTGGAGVEIGARRGAVTIEGRANFGVRDISKAADSTTRSRAVVGLIGVRF